MPPDRPPERAARFVPIAAAVALLGTVVLAGVAGGLGGDDDAATPTSGSHVGTAVVGSTSAPPTTRPRRVKTQLERTLESGMSGKDVRRLQVRLDELGFAPGPIDGVFGSLTEAAVWAYEKLVDEVPREQATGQVDNARWQDMQGRVRITPRRPEAETRNHTEIYLPEQVLVVFHDGKPAFISHISSGDGEKWCSEVTIDPGEYGNEEGTEPLKRGECGISATPGGVFNYYRRVDGVRESNLGGMLNPVYFNYGIAVHGAYNVPLQPASHGCIRIPNAVSEAFGKTVALGDQVFVFDGVEEPETYGAQVPPFNTIDPDYTTTTTSTTSTTTTTTTTVPPTRPPATQPPATEPPPTEPPATEPPHTETTTTPTSDPRGPATTRP